MVREERIEAKERAPDPAEEKAIAEAAAAAAKASAAAAIAAAQRFVIRKQPNGAYRLKLAGDESVYLQEDPTGSQHILAATGDGAERGMFRLKRLVPPNKYGSQTSSNPRSGGKEKTFKRRVKRSTVSIGSREFVVATYHNIGMLDWARLFWGWLMVSGIDRFMLLELDGQTCEAAKALNCSLSVECVTAYDMMLPREYTQIAQAGGLQSWGTDAESAYFKFLRWKMRLTELVLSQGVDFLMIDVDVLVLGPDFFTTLTKFKDDLVIASDARQGSYNNMQNCPCSHTQYQRYTADWVCAGEFYMRSTQASIWFMREVQRLMDDFTITDQDAIQAILTGHTQVAIPQSRLRNESHKGRARRPSNAWHKPIWVEGLGVHQNIRNGQGALPANTPMKEEMWDRYELKHRQRGFTWRTLPLQQFGNGPMLVHHWDSTFSRPPESLPASRFGSFLSIHANCFAKQWVSSADKTGSSLFRPR